MRSKIASGSSSCSLWRQMGNIISQYDGVYLLHILNELSAGKLLAGKISPKVFLLKLSEITIVNKTVETGTGYYNFFLTYSRL